MNYRHIVFVLPLNFQVASPKLAQIRSYKKVSLIISQYSNTPHMWAQASPQFRDPIHGILKCNPTCRINYKVKTWIEFRTTCSKTIQITINPKRLSLIENE